MKKIFLCLGLIYAFNSNAQTQQVIDLSTGVVNGSAGLSPIGSNDDTWTVKIPGGTTFQSAGVSNNVMCSNPPGGPLYIALWSYYTGQGPWDWYDTVNNIHNSCGNSHISPFTVTTPGPAFGYIDAYVSPIGTYQYKMTFPKLNCTAMDVTLNIPFAFVDNSLDSISINGHVHSLVAQNINFGNVLLPPPFSLTIPVSELVSGTNTVLVYVKNESGPTTMLICGNITINYASDPNLVPSFTGLTNFCAGSPLTFVGSDGPSTATNYFWEIIECNSYAVITPGGFVWSSWYAGSPGTFTFPANLNLPCGKTYRVKLAVQNPCDSWKEVTKLITVACPPRAFAGDDVTICKGSCAYLGEDLFPNKTYSYTWNTGQLGSSIQVCPATTTTYTLTVKNKLTGCITTDVVTVNVVNNEPGFSFTNINTTNPNYFTVTAVPNDIGAINQPGFGYVWKVEDLSLSGSAILLIDNSSCWWGWSTSNPGNYANSFNGFDHVNNNYSGNTTLSNCSSPASGMFLYNHNYRITRGTWNQVCPWNQIAFYMSYAKSMNGSPVIIITEDENAPDISYLKNTAGIENNTIENTKLSIYPNPSNGVFTIEMSIDKKSSVEVYDALGKKVRSFEQTNFRSELDLWGFPKGMYMINIISEGKQISKKIILE